jgi:hypothetical protein
MSLPPNLPPQPIAPRVAQIPTKNKQTNKTKKKRKRKRKKNLSKKAKQNQHAQHVYEP